ncbi:MAG: NAD-dependent epimerase/dehydratase [Frondihabitans sp.]|nr:NAD-dependent epimerase/dehydratase [Frondihabitans sp.]
MSPESEPSPMTIAVTGASGFLGRQVAAALRAHGHDVRGLDVTPDRDGGGTVVDLSDPDATREALAGCTGVVHLAGYPRAGDHTPHDVFTTNTSISFSVIDAAVDVGVTDLVFVSSVSVIGYPFFTHPIVPDHLPLDEAIVSTPQDSYGVSKAVGEFIIDSAVARSGGTLGAVSLRFPALHTPESFVREMPATYETGKDSRLLWNYIDTRDAAEACAVAFNRSNVGHTKLFLAAADSFDPRPTAELLADHFPEVPVTHPVDGHTSLMNSDEAIAYLGFTPRYSWRQYEGTTDR